MFTLSEAAGQLLNEMLVGADVPDDAVLRIVTEEEGLGVTLDQVAPEDQKFDHAGRVVLVFNEELGDLLDERRLELEQSADGPQLALVQRG